MFSRARHQQIAELLGALDADLLRNHRCLFGGGTAIALRRAALARAETAYGNAIQRDLLRAITKMGA